MNIQLITQDAYANKYWQPVTQYQFAKDTLIAPLVLAELVKAQQTLPIAFTKTDDNYTTVAVLGLTDGNALVNQHGQWFPNAYIPAVFRSYPFRLAKNEDNQLLLCIDEDSGLVNEMAGEAFFDNEGKPTERVQAILNMLVSIDNNQTATQTAIAALAQHNLITPWQFTLKTDEGNKTIEGLYRIDEEALNALTGEALEDIIKVGGLVLAYSQLFSMQNMATVTDLIRAHVQASVKQKSALPLTATGDLNLDYLNQMGGLDFSNFK
jgi:hypothetical protein